MAQIRIPTAFYSDHRDRDLPTPEVIGMDRRGYLIDTDDEAFAELKADAEFYATNSNDAPLWLKSAAAALLRAISAA